MDTPFRGRFEIKSDSKGRLSLPKGLHPSFANNNSDIFITNSQFKGERNLDVYTAAEWENLEARIAKMSPLKSEVQEFKRFYMASAQPVSVDKNNRILIPSMLRKYANLQDEVVLVGLGNKLEIWAMETWEKLFNQLASNFEQTLGAVAALDEGGD